MSYYKSKWVPFPDPDPGQQDQGTAEFYFHGQTVVRIPLCEKPWMEVLEKLFDHCYNLGIAHEKVLQRACVAEWENRYVATVD